MRHACIAVAAVALLPAAAVSQQFKARDLPPLAAVFDEAAPPATDSFSVGVDAGSGNPYGGQPPQMPGGYGGQQQQQQQYMQQQQQQQYMQQQQQQQYMQQQQQQQQQQQYMQQQQQQQQQGQQGQQGQQAAQSSAQAAHEAKMAHYQAQQQAAMAAGRELPSRWGTPVGDGEWEVPPTRNVPDRTQVDIAAAAAEAAVSGWETPSNDDPILPRKNFGDERTEPPKVCLAFLSCCGRIDMLERTMVRTRTHTAQHTGRRSLVASRQTRRLSAVGRPLSCRLTLVSCAYPPTRPPTRPPTHPPTSGGGGAAYGGGRARP